MPGREDINQIIKKTAESVTKLFSTDSKSHFIKLHLLHAIYQKYSAELASIKNFNGEEAKLTYQKKVSMSLESLLQGIASLEQHTLALMYEFIELSDPEYNKQLSSRYMVKWFNDTLKSLVTELRALIIARTYLQNIFGVAKFERGTFFKLNRFLAAAEKCMASVEFFTKLYQEIETIELFLNEDLGELYRVTLLEIEDVFNMHNSSPLSKSGAENLKEQYFNLISDFPVDGEFEPDRGCYGPACQKAALFKASVKRLKKLLSQVCPEEETVDDEYGRSDSYIIAFDESGQMGAASEFIDSAKDLVRLAPALANFSAYDSAQKEFINQEIKSSLIGCYNSLSTLVTEFEYNSSLLSATQWSYIKNTERRCVKQATRALYDAATMLYLSLFDRQYFLSQPLFVQQAYQEIIDGHFQEHKLDYQLIDSSKILESINTYNQQIQLAENPIGLLSNWCLSVTSMLESDWLFVAGKQEKAPALSVLDLWLQEIITQLQQAGVQIDRYVDLYKLSKAELSEKLLAPVKPSYKENEANKSNRTEATVDLCHIKTSDLFVPVGRVEVFKTHYMQAVKGQWCPMFIKAKKVGDAGVVSLMFSKESTAVNSVDKDEIRVTASLSAFSSWG